MTVIRIPYDTPHYLVHSGELVSGSVISGSLVTEGGACYVYDLKKWKVINSDMSLTDMVISVVGGASGSFRATSGEKVTVVNGIITSMV